MNLFTKQKQSHRSKKTNLWLPQQGINWEIEINIYTLLSINQIANKDLLYSTGNSTQLSLMAYMGKESKQKKSGYKYMYITNSLCCTAESNTTL